MLQDSDGRHFSVAAAGSQTRVLCIITRARDSATPPFEPNAPFQRRMSLHIPTLAVEQLKAEVLYSLVLLLSSFAAMLIKLSHTQTHTASRLPPPAWVATPSIQALRLMSDDGDHDYASALTLLSEAIAAQPLDAHLWMSRYAHCQPALTTLITSTAPARSTITFTLVQEPPS